MKETQLPVATNAALPWVKAAKQRPVQRSGLVCGSNRVIISGSVFVLLLTSLIFGLQAQQRSPQPEVAMISSKSKAAAPRERTGTDGLFVVVVNSKRGYIDRTGKIVIEPRFESASNFSEGLAFVALGGRENKKGYVDQTGKLIIMPRFDAVRDFHEGLAAVGVNLNEKRGACDDCEPNQHWGYIDKNGGIVIKPLYRHAGDFSEGLAAVQADDGKWGFIDKNGRTVVKLQYDYAYGFSEGLACVLAGKEFGYVDGTGRMVIKPQFSTCHAFSGGLAATGTGGEAVSPVDWRKAIGQPGRVRRFIDKNGRTIIKLAAETADDFSEGLAPFEVKKSDGNLNCGYIDQRGKVIISPQFSSCGQFSEGLALILHNAKWSYIDRSGKILFTTPFTLASEFRDGLAEVQLGGSNVFASEKPKYGYIDRSGSTVWKPTN